MLTRPTLVASFVLLSLVVAVTSTMAADPQPSIKLVIDYGDGVQKHFNSLPHKNEMTVLSAMQLADKHPRGISFTHRGRGATAFLTKIDDVENEGRGRNWLFYVNEKRADRGFGAYSLKPGDVVLWRFEKYQ